MELLISYCEERASISNLRRLDKTPMLFYLKQYLKYDSG